MQKYSSSNEHNELARKLALYLPLGYPNWEMFYRVLQEIEGHGIGCVEIGLPVSNPFMDGETIQATHRKMLPLLDAGTVYKELINIRKVFSSKIILMTYREGLDNFQIKKLPYWSYDAILCVNGEQSRDDYSGIVKIFSETMTDEEMREALSKSTEFAYVVSAVGKTGGNLLSQNAYIETIKKLRKISEIPIYVGFGIKGLADIKQVISNGANGAIIGTEFIKILNCKDIEKIRNFINKLLD